MNTAIAPQVWFNPANSTQRPKLAIDNTDPRQVLKQLGKSDHSSKWIVLLNPPRVPTRGQLARFGIDFTKVLVVKTKRNIASALNKALTSDTTKAVLAWCDSESNKISINQEKAWVFESKKPKADWSKSIQMHLPMY